MFSEREEILIYFDDNSFDSVTTLINKCILVRHLRRPIRWPRKKDPCRVKIRILIRMGALYLELGRF